MFHLIITPLSNAPTNAGNITVAQVELISNSSNAPVLHIPTSNQPNGFATLDSPTWLAQHGSSEQTTIAQDTPFQQQHADATIPQDATDSNSTVEQIFTISNKVHLAETSEVTLGSSSTVQNFLSIPNNLSSFSSYISSDADGTICKEEYCLTETSEVQVGTSNTVQEELSISNVPDSVRQR
uniref:Uncharacterized protein n=1 Tax=Anopheles dirus TaxID=7168 RepID=A0A182NY19_9DIPT